VDYSKEESEIELDEGGEKLANSTEEIYGKMDREEIEGLAKTNKFSDQYDPNDYNMNE
jgi:hypothetical protein